MIVKFDEEDEAQGEADGKHVIRAKIRQKFDEFFTKKYREKNSPEFRVIHSESKKFIGISHITYIHGLEHLENLNLIKITVINSRKSLITLSENYLKELGADGNDTLSSDAFDEISKLKENPETGESVIDESSANDECKELKRRLQSFEEELEILKQTLKAQRLLIDVLELKTQRYEDKTTAR